MALHLPLAWLLLAGPFADASASQSAVTQAVGWAARCAQRIDRARDQFPPSRNGRAQVSGSPDEIYFKAQVGEALLLAMVENAPRSFTKDQPWGETRAPAMITRERIFSGRRAVLNATAGDAETKRRFFAAFQPAVDACLEEASRVKAQTFMWEGRLKRVEPVGLRAVTALQVEVDPRYLITFEIASVKPTTDAPFTAGTTQVFAVHSPSRLCDHKTVDGHHRFWLSGETDQGRTTWRMEPY
jgi:hypothetical protein